MKDQEIIDQLNASLLEALEEDRIRETLTRYRDRKITRRRASTMLKVSERQVNRMMVDYGYARLEGARRLADELAQRRRELRQSAAALVDAGKITVQQAATRAGCSERTIYRYLKS